MNYYSLWYVRKDFICITYQMIIVECQVSYGDSVRGSELRLIKAREDLTEVGSLETRGDHTTVVKKESRS